VVHGSTDVLQVSSREPSELDSALAELREVATLQGLVREGGSAITMIRSCACYGAELDSIAEENGCLHIGPNTHIGGWELLRLFAPNRAAVQR